MPEPKQIKVFLCHSSNDKPVVRELYQKLCAESWIDPWLDEVKLFPGQDWNLEIEKAVEAADVILVCLSSNSITKEGYVQRELRIVLDYADYKPEGTLYLIPVRLEDCEPPRRVRLRQYADFFPPERRDWAFKRLLVSLKMRAQAIGVLLSQTPNLPQLPSEKLKKIPLEPTLTHESEHHISPNLQSDNHLTFDEMNLCLIPAGKFIMGSEADEKEAYDDEKPQHIVEISYDYWLARFTVTNMQFEHFVHDTGYKTAAERKGSAYCFINSRWKEINGANWRNPRGPQSSIEKKRNYPVVSVSWLDAMEYCRWLDWKLKINFQSSYHPDDFVFRLPTEAEWEKAARGVNRNIFPWGSEEPVVTNCNFRQNIKDTVPVDAYPKNISPFGCEQMAGNVWEWTHSLFKTYPYDHLDGRESLNIPTNRVLRGGSFDLNRQFMRSACRNIDDRVGEDLGFRVCFAPKLDCNDGKNS